MRNSIKNEKGFTLIELVMVIVILGILAATAIPKFVDLKGSAETSAAAGVTGALAANITILHANYLIKGGTIYSISDVADVDTSGITLAGSGTTITTTDIGDSSSTHTWTYTPPASGAAGKISDAVKS